MSVYSGPINAGLVISSILHRSFIGLFESSVPGIALEFVSVLPSVLPWWPFPSQVLTYYDIGLKYSSGGPAVLIKRMLDMVGIPSDTIMLC